MSKPFITVSLTIIILSSFLSYVFAGSFKVVPIKLFLDSRKKTSILKVTNNGDEKVTVQLEAKEWTQDELGKDRYKDTKDIVFFPRMAEIEKGRERIVRVGYQITPGAKEKTYRLFIRELPIIGPGEVALKFAMRFAVPVFISPPEEIKERSIKGAQLKEGSLLIDVKNKGNSHFIISKIRVTGKDKEGNEVFSKEIGGWYVLAGITKRYAVEIQEDDCLRTDTIKVGVDVENSSMNTEVKVDNTQCKGPEEKGQEKGGQLSGE